MQAKWIKLDPMVSYELAGSLLVSILFIKIALQLELCRPGKKGHNSATSFALQLFNN